MASSRWKRSCALASLLVACTSEGPSASGAGAGSGLPGPDPKSSTTTEFVTTASGSGLLTALTRGPDGIVAVGAGVLVSRDRQHWFHRPIGLGLGGLTDLLWDDKGKRFLASENSFGVSRSSDGKDWHPAAQLSSGEMRGLARAGDRMIVVGRRATGYSSDAGEHWTRAVLPGPLASVTWSTRLERFVAVGDAGAIYTTADAQTWTKVASGVAVDLRDVAELEGRLFAVGEGETILASDDARSFRIIQSDPSSQYAYSSIATSGERIVAVGGHQSGDRPMHRIATSADGERFDALATPGVEGFGALHEVLWDRDQFLAVGGAGAVLTSEDGLSWTLRSMGTDFHAIAWSGSSYVAVGLRVAAVSKSGKDWEFFSPLHGEDDLFFEDIAWTGSQFVAVARVGLTKYVARSADGQRWALVESTACEFLRAVASSTRVAVAVGTQCAVRSTDGGTTWEPVRTGFAGTLADLVWAGDRFVAVGSEGAVFTSADGATWLRQAAPIGQGIKFVAWSEAKNLLLALGNTGTLLVSADRGASWTLVALESSSDNPFDAAFSGLAYGGGQFVAYGRQGALLTSVDGKDWTTRTIDNRRTIHGIAFGSDVVVTAGEEGVLTVGRFE